jgi:sec-independent protein translocase protein TatA
MGIGVWELVVILLIVLLLFGARKVPELAKGLGSGLREFRKAVKDDAPGGGDAKSAQAGEPPSPNNAGGVSASDKEQP